MANNAGNLISIQQQNFNVVKRIRNWNGLFYTIAGIGALLMLFPLVWAILASLKSYSELLADPLGFIPRQWAFRNYIDVFTAVPFHLYFLNTFKITLACTAGTLFTSAIAAYAFARLRFPGRDYLFMGYLATLMIPRQIILVPTFLIMRYLGLLDSHLSLILPGLFTAYGTFLLRQFFLSIPIELEEAATIDGCGYFKRFGQIIMPLSKPALATLAIFTMMNQWNDYLYPMIFLNSEQQRTLVMGLAIFRGDVDVQWNLVMAAVTLASLPMIIAFLSAQRFFVEGVATSGLKG
jgi:multiple sugar transport system permease protein